MNPSAHKRCCYYQFPLGRPQDEPLRPPRRAFSSGLRGRPRSPWASGGKPGVIPCESGQHGQHRARRGLHLHLDFIRWSRVGGGRAEPARRRATGATEAMASLEVDRFSPFVCFVAARGHQAWSSVPAANQEQACGPGSREGPHGPGPAASARAAATATLRPPRRRVSPQAACGSPWEPKLCLRVIRHQAGW